ncbi:MAG: hypothetical protein IKA36_01020 [Clostridia bacterium]|nr:hypothetical protein [Clostridia bacterium]
MPRDFKTFCENNKKIINENQEKANDYQSIIDKYKNMNQNDLMNNLFSEASKLKQEGKLDSNSLNSMKDMIAPFLNNDQKTMLNSIIDKINE